MVYPEKVVVAPPNPISKDEFAYFSQLLDSEMAKIQTQLENLEHMNRNLNSKIDDVQTYASDIESFMGTQHALYETAFEEIENELDRVVSKTNELETGFESSATDTSLVLFSPSSDIKPEQFVVEYHWIRVGNTTTVFGRMLFVGSVEKPVEGEGGETRSSMYARVTVRMPVPLNTELMGGLVSYYKPPDGHVCIHSPRALTHTWYMSNGEMQYLDSGFVRAAKFSDDLPEYLGLYFSYPNMEMYPNSTFFFQCTYTLDAIDYAARAYDGYIPEHERRPM